MSGKPPGDDYQVGYGKPPVATRFQKGVSGNPKGRPKGRRNTAAVLLAAMYETIVVTEAGRRRRITKIEAVAKQLANKAAGGDRHAMRLALELMDLAETRVEAQAAATLSTQDRRASDAAILAGLRARLSPGGGRGDG